MLDDVRGALVIAYKLLLMMMMLFLGSTDAIAAVTKCVVATTCHRVESARKALSLVTSWQGERAGEIAPLKSVSYTHLTLPTILRV